MFAVATVSCASQGPEDAVTWTITILTLKDGRCARGSEPVSLNEVHKSKLLTMPMIKTQTSNTDPMPSCELKSVSQDSYVATVTC